jgi:hypothetical protein
MFLKLPNLKLLFKLIFLSIHLEPYSILNNILKFSSYLTGNTVLIHNKSQQLNSIYAKVK